MSIFRLAQLAASGLDRVPEGAWDLSYLYPSPPAWASFDNISVANSASNGIIVGGNIVTGLSGPYAIFIKPDGSKSYVVDRASGNIHEYDLPSKWIHTVNSLVQSFVVSTSAPNPQDIVFNNDGTVLMVLSSPSTVYEFSLSTPWDVSTLSYTSKSFAFAGNDNQSKGFAFNPDGTLMFVVGDQNDKVYKYVLSTAWDISTASYSGQSVSVTATPAGLAIASSGRSLFTMYDGSNWLYHYRMTTPWDLSTLSTVGYRDVGASGLGQTYGLYLKPDNSALYIVDNNTPDYYSSLAVNWSGVTEGSPNGIEFSPDGTSAYLVGSSRDAVQYFTLSTPWDADTRSRQGEFLSSAQGLNPVGVRLSADGTKMYVATSSNSTIFEYSLSTPWNAMTATYTGNSKVYSGQATSIGSFTFKGDGTKLFIGGNGAIYEYNLATPWSLGGTVSYVGARQPSGALMNHMDIQFDPSGGTVFIFNGDDRIHQHSLSTPWDLTTASFVREYNMGTVYNTSRNSFYVSPDGLTLAIANINPDSWLTFKMGVQS